jgi:hypothetical protein
MSKVPLTVKLSPGEDCHQTAPDVVEAARDQRPTVTRGRLNGELDIQLGNAKPGLDFDLFTVERTS